MTARKRTQRAKESAAEQRAVIYLRVSTKEQAEMGGEAEGFSIPAQRDACRRKAESLGAVVAEEFVDRGESARTANRPELLRMLGYLREQSVQYVIVHKVDRLARSRADDVVINLEIQKSGARLVSCSENIDETPSGLLLHGIMSSIAEFYSRNLATEVAKGMTQKAQSGGTTHRAPVGYVNVEKLVEGRRVRTVELDQERAPLVRWAFEAYATGEWTLTQLQAELTARGFSARPTRRWPERPYARAGLAVMLANPYYTGVVTYAGVSYPGKHEPLISVELFERVQDALASHNHAGERQYRHNHYLKGSIYCGRCGKRLAVTNSRNHAGVIYDYFYCLGRQRDRWSCDQTVMRIKTVERLIEDHYVTVTLAPEQLEAVRSALKHALADKKRRAEVDERAAARRIQRLDAERHKLLQLHYADAMPVDLFKEEQQRIARELENARRQLQAVSLEFDTIEDNLNRALELARDCHAAYKAATPKVRRLFNQAFFEKIYIDDDGQVTHDLAEPFRTLLDPRLPSELSEEKGRRTSSRKPRSDRWWLPEDDKRTPRSDVLGSNVSVLVPPEGFEPSTSRSGGARSNPLSYEGTDGHSSTAGARSPPGPPSAVRRSRSARPPTPVPGKPQPAARRGRSPRRRRGC